MKNNKAPGDDGIVIDIIKEGGQELYQHIAKLFTNCLSKHKTPEAWNNSIIILLHKKRYIKDINNYRPISLLSHMSKLFGKVIKNRIEKQLDFNQAREQAGLVVGCYTTLDTLLPILLLHPNIRRIVGSSGYLFNSMNSDFNSMNFQIWRTFIEF